jgi:hypothetical protein
VPDGNDLQAERSAAAVQRLRIQLRRVMSERAQRASLFIALACAVRAFGCSGSDAGGASRADAAFESGSGKDATSGSDSGSATDAGAKDAATTDAASTTGGTGFTTPNEMFEHVNATRMQYASHTPYDGYPWVGQNAPTMSWQTTLTWDAALAAEAQTEAESLAQGAAPAGNEYAYQAPTPGESIWLTGLDSPKYRLSAFSDEATVGTPAGPFTSGDPGKWHLTQNGTYRLAVAYQTGTGSYSTKKKLGVGMSAAGATRVFWVLIFGE